jgi:hypothetical protein
MKIIHLFLMLSAFLVTESSYAEIGHLSTTHRNLLRNIAEFHILKGKDKMPPAVIALCADSTGQLAAPGERWEATDVITDRNLPRKRLIWAAVYKNYYLIHYERGGYSHSFHILLAQTTGTEKAEALWRAAGEKYTDPNAFSKALNKNELDDDPRYFY